MRAGAGMARVLVVDGAAELQELWRIVLAQDRHRVTTVADGTAALATYQTDSPDLMITDLEIPALPGLALIERVRVLRPDAKIIAVSENQALLRSARSLGVCLALLKPFGVMDLVRGVRRSLRAPARPRIAHGHGMR